MKLYFESFSDFIAMGGHGFYVWLCYAIVAVALVGQYVIAKRSESQAKQTLKRFYARQEKLSNAEQTSSSEVN